VDAPDAAWIFTVRSDSQERGAVTVNVYPTDCLVLAARGMRAHGVTQRELDLMYKVNPAKLLGLPSLEEIGGPPTTANRQ